MIKTLLAVILALSFGVGSGPGQTTKAPPPQTTEIASIDSYVLELDRFVKRNQKLARIFADVSSASTDEKSDWKEFKTEKAREDAGTGDNLNQNAYVWKRAGKTVRTNFTFGSPSGDWAHFVYYSFRDDGSLAKIHGELNTFYGDLSVISDHYYSREGKLLKTKRLFLDLKTRKPKRPGDYEPKKPEPVFKKASDLPFFKLL